MDHFTFDKIPCSICNEAISKGGAAYSSHMRAHVRKGEAQEFKRNGKLVFVTNDRSYMETDPYAKLGDEQLPGQPKDIWEMPDLDKELPPIIPSAYFITSGEAVMKAEKLVKDSYSMAVKAKALFKKLQRAKGDKKYLETARENGRLLLKAKNGRKAKEPTTETTIETEEIENDD